MKRKEIEITLNDDKTVSFSDFVNTRAVYETLCREKDKEIEELHSIIKEVREYIEHAQNYGKEKVIYVNGNDILEILEKENKQ